MKFIFLFFIGVIWFIVGNKMKDAHFKRLKSEGYESSHNLVLERLNIKEWLIFILSLIFCLTLIVLVINF